MMMTCVCVFVCALDYYWIDIVNVGIGNDCTNVLEFSFQPYSFYLFFFCLANEIANGVEISRSETFFRVLPFF